MLTNLKRIVVAPSRDRPKRRQAGALQGDALSGRPLIYLGTPPLSPHRNISSGFLTVFSQPTETVGNG